jgi:hypothetical protein
MLSAMSVDSELAVYEELAQLPGNMLAIPLRSGTALLRSSDLLHRHATRRRCLQCLGGAQRLALAVTTQQCHHNARRGARPHTSGL